jgi:hypothetical protein
MIAQLVGGKTDIFFDKYKMSSYRQNELGDKSLSQIHFPAKRLLRDSRLHKRAERFAHVFNDGRAFGFVT